MADHLIIREVSARLGELLFQGLKGVVGGFNSKNDDVSFEPPLAAANHPPKLSVWLYQIVENEFTKNRPSQRVANDEEQLAPLTINLLYLVTPMEDTIKNHETLGRVMQILHDNARTIVEDNPLGQNPKVVAEISISLYRRTLEELTRIWDALREPYRLSVCYEVRLARIDSQRRVRTGRVGNRELAEEALS